MQYNVFVITCVYSPFFISIIEVGNKHGNGDKFLDFANLFFFFGIKNVRVGGKILRSVGRSETHIFFGPICNLIFSYKE
jgi:hypothetical protein